MSVVNLWVGAITHEGCRVVAKKSPGANVVELLVSTSPNVSSPDTFLPVSDVNDIVTFEVDGLAPGTRYFYGVDEDSTFDFNVDPVGTFRTVPAAVGNPVSFTFGAGGCAGAGPPAFPGDGTELDPVHVSNHPVFDELASRGVDENWQFFLHTGDMHYYNIGSDKPATLANYRRALDDVLHQPFQQDLYKNLPLVYMWDDHDGGPNNWDGTYEHKLLPQQVYRERVPSYPLAAPGDDLNNNPIYHSFQIGRVLFIAADLRSSKSPNTNPDDQNKTMMGENQKVWLNGVLANSDAHLLVLISSVPWVRGTGNENWAGYTTESAELIDMFRQHDFLDRMFVISGDAHYMAMDDGTNTPGNIPSFVSNHLDSSPSGNTVQWSQGDPINNKGQYGTVTITDDEASGTMIVLWRGWGVGQNLLREFSFTVSEAGITPTTPQPHEPVPPSVAKIESTVTWLVCRIDNQTAAHPVVAELPDLRASQLQRVLGEHTTSSLELPIPSLGGEGMTLGQRAALVRTLLFAAVPRVLIVAIINGIPAWVGLPLKPIGGTDPNVRIGVATVEAYTARRYVRGHAWEDEDIGSTIAAGILGDVESSINGVGGGLGLIVDAPDTGVLATRNYSELENQTCYDALVELMSVDDGVEWTVDPVWADDRQNSISLIARVRRRIGSTVEAVFQVAASSVFQAQGSSETTYNFDVDYGPERFANVVQAYSTGEGEDQPVSDFVLDTGQLVGGIPIFEDRFQAGPNLDKTALDQHATARLARLKQGTRVFAVSSRWDAYPRFGVDWRLGDDVSYDLVGHLHPGIPDGGHRARGTARAIGVQFDFANGRAQPVLLDPTVVG